MRGGLALVVLSVLFAAPVSGVDVHIGVNVGVPPPPPPPIVIEAPPPLVIVPGSPVYYAPSLPYNFFYYDGAYYAFHDSHWFLASSAHGPWTYVRRVPRPVLAVPVRYYRVPPGQLKKHGPPPWAGHGHGHGHGHGKHED
jgi:hypothetical protein